MKKSKYKLIIYILGVVMLFSFGAISLLGFYSQKPQSSCADDFDCDAGEKCENSICVDVDCVIESGDLPGAIAPEYIEHMPDNCCEGLEEIDYAGNYDENCDLSDLAGGPSGTCSRCGNGSCEEWESKCNCPADCE
ncbi:MAG: hypothetical protein ABH837_03095 [bacterium]